MIILAVDLGKARTGLAVCDSGEILASPAGVISEYNMQNLVEKVAQEAHKRKAEKIVVGLPKNMDGSEGASAQNAREFSKQLQEISKLPVDLQDERGTTITAHGFLNETNTRGKKRKAVVDAVAATIILQNYIDRKKINSN